MPGTADRVRILADSPLLRSADRSCLKDLRSLLEWVDLAENKALATGSAHGDALYFVAAGHLEMLLGAEDGDGNSSQGAPRVVARYTTGEVVGDLQTLTGDGQRATVRAASPAKLVKLPKKGFDHFLATHPDVAEKLTDVLTPQLYRRQMLRVLNDMFGELTPDMLADIEGRAAWHHVSARGNSLLAGRIVGQGVRRSQRPASGAFHTTISASWGHGIRS